MEDKKEFQLDNFITGKPTMEFVLQNGDEFKDLLKKAQQDTAELQKDLKHLSDFTPVFKMK